MIAVYPLFLRLTLSVCSSCDHNESVRTYVPQMLLLMSSFRYSVNTIVLLHIITIVRNQYDHVLLD